MWSAAEALYGMPGLPTALAMAIPFGAFGALDYLAGSAETVGALCGSVLLHLSIVAVDVQVAHVQMDDGQHLVEVRGCHAKALEFSLAAICGRLRHVTGGAFRPMAVGLPAERPDDDPVRKRLWGAPISYAQPCASLRMDQAIWQRRIDTADPYLHATLKQVAAQLQLAPSPSSDLEQALRVRLRDALAQGRADRSDWRVCSGFPSVRCSVACRIWVGVSLRSSRIFGTRKRCACCRISGCNWRPSPAGWVTPSRPRSPARSGAGPVRRRALGAGLAILEPMLLSFSPGRCRYGRAGVAQ